MQSAPEPHGPRALVEQNAALRAHVTRMRSELEALHVRIPQMRSELEALRADNAELRRRLAAVEGAAARKLDTGSSATFDRVRWVREMLRDRGSRNP